MRRPKMVHHRCAMTYYFEGKTFTEVLFVAVFGAFPECIADR